MSGIICHNNDIKFVSFLLFVILASHNIMKRVVAIRKIRKNSDGTFIRAGIKFPTMNWADDKRQTSTGS